MIQRKESSIPPEEEGGSQKRLYKEMKYLLLTAHQLYGFYKIFGPITPGWGREQLPSEERMPSAFLQILPQVNVGGLLCIPPRKLFPHCAYL